MPPKLIFLFVISALLLAAQDVVGWRVWVNEVRNGGADSTERLSCVGEKQCDELWKQIPPAGLQVIMVYYSDGRRRIVKGVDYYWRCEATPDNLCQGMTDPGGERRLGLTISDEEFERIHSEAWAARAAPE